MSYMSNGGSNIRSADMFLTRALEKLLTDKEIKKSNNAQLKKQIETLLGKFKIQLISNFIKYSMCHKKKILS